MVSSKLLVILAIAISAFVVLSAAEAEKKKHEWKCLGQTMNGTTEDKDAMKKCGEEIKAKMESSGDSDNNSDDGEAKKKQNKKWWSCFMSCQNKKNGILNSDNKFDVSVWNAMVDKKFPEAAREGLKADGAKCADKITETLSDDDHCKNHAAYQKCTMDAMKKHCKQEEETF